MSTKIYTGFMLGCSDLNATMSWLQSLQKSTKLLCNRRKTEALAKMTTRRIDNAISSFASGKQHKKPLPVRPFRETQGEIFERQKAIRATRERDPEVDFEVVYALWFVPEMQTFVGHVVGEDSGKVYKMLRGRPGVADYRYWNNTDKPRNIRSVEWELRGDLWNRIIKQEFGLPLTLTIDAEAWIDLKSVTKCVPSYESRTNKIALEWAYDEWLPAVHPELLVDNKYDYVDEVVRAYLDFSDEVDQPGTKAADMLAVAKSKVLGFLPKDISSLLSEFSEQAARSLMQTTAELEASD